MSARAADEANEGDNVKKDAHPRFRDTIASISDTTTATVPNSLSPSSASSSAAASEDDHNCIRTSHNTNIDKSRHAGKAAIHPSLKFIRIFSVAFLILVLVSSRPELFFFTHQVLLVSTMVHVGLARAC